MALGTPTHVSFSFLTYPFVGGPIYTPPPLRPRVSKVELVIEPLLMYLPMWDSSYMEMTSLVEIKASS